ncbi:MAG: hypothetical protein ACI8QD_001072, partial [Cyclobacteriaceae bacterium]
KPRYNRNAGRFDSCRDHKLTSYMPQILSCSMNPAKPRYNRNAGDFCH